ncbi:DUF1697 domain-containing protein [Flavicella sediminum]|uniref:DUF1697 domain-containing protein n=1 Tax=Flavicella sediminum TaxID=2585141 RepID=UPI00111E4F14|nr:DUF1697 domain-containing protein [Flavicella sediminum]
MTTFIVLLRGINVSGKNRLKMQDLLAMLAKHQLKNCQSYIQSGNLIVKTKLSKGDLKNLIEEQLLQEFSIETEALVFSKVELLQICTSINYQNEPTKERYYTFLTRTPNKECLLAAASIDTANDSFVCNETTIYIHCPGGYGKTKLSNNFFEKKLKCKATTRNYNTLNKLLLLSQ